MKRCLCCGRPLGAGDAFYHATCMKKLFRTNHVPAFDLSQEALNDLAKSTILARVSVPGVQPKLSVHLEIGSSDTGARLTLVGLEGDYILKPQTPDWTLLPEAEHFCMTFARICKIATAEFGLIPLQSGECAYITRRMDRDADEVLHMEDFCQITDKLTAQKYNGSMEQVGKALRQYSSVPGLDVVRFFELAVFSYLSGNSDMHLKNFSLIRYLDGRYELSPAYDLVPVKLVMPADKEEMALTLNGKKSKLKRQDFEKFGTAIGLTPVQSEKAISRICEAAKANVSDALACSFMTEEMNNRFLDAFNIRLRRFEG